MIEKQWVRICQECNHRQVDVDPNGSPTEAYCERKCKKCKSSSLDWGSMRYLDSQIDEASE